MGVLLEWSPPLDSSQWDKVYIYRSDSENGAYIKIAEQDISDTTYYDKYGSGNNWYKVSYYNSADDIESAPSEPMEASDSRGYVTIDEVRMVTGVQQAEFSNTAIQFMIDSATKLIDERTGRTWQQINTVQNEYYSGSGNNTLYLNHPDVQSVSSLYIKQYPESSEYTQISSDYIEIEQPNIVKLSNEAEVSTFTKGANTVKISYTWGNETPPYEVKYLCLLMVANMMHIDKNRSQEIDSIINKIKWKVGGLY